MPHFLRPTIDIPSLVDGFNGMDPFRHVVIEDFFLPEIAEQIAAEFPAFDGDAWAVYNNSIEIKKALNHWDRFPKTTYSVFDYLNSDEFVAKMSALAGVQLYADHGLHGGGWHSHAQGGKLNTHLDYSIHPKLGMERLLNLIIYVTPGWQKDWAGELGFWKDEKGTPGELRKTTEPFFNRALIFDTSQQSWHGLPDPVLSPLGVTRNSLAVYYLCEPRESAAVRGRALFAPHGAQASDPQVLELIKKRSEVATSHSVYRQS
jgi:Rps23 Pro-64 3,4-dihydroxylase Tpa1-like proline 4-hydroxylase